MKILIVDEEPDVVRLISVSFGMQQSNWEILAASDGEEGLTMLERERPALVLLDVGLPDMSGFQVLEQIRLFSDVPVIMLTVHDDELSKVRGLELGADDYITKPFSHLELLARVRAVLRRAQSLPLAHEKPFVSGDLTVDFVRREVTRHGEPVPLTATEYRLLYHLVRNAGQVLPHETLLARVWGREYTDEINYLKVYVSRLRAKLEDDPRNPQHILTEHGIGYWFRK
ncbi:MAG TPA: response regulator transcription factor [Anaerolineae bacterium]|nr:response regulator transcription factor [Anaerolineae bacterium]HQE98724.1 response regulator transcription factor [Anaerolineae bacterium]HQJ10431.1 response regulator transcription factor [Anaerolineae bacterium]HUM37263.1 response regulator transcription factor [Anaerolineae bacterium]